MEMVVIHPREGVSADEIAAWLSENFQRPHDLDLGPEATRTRVIEGGNPLVNARISTVDIDPGRTSAP